MRGAWLPGGVLVGLLGGLAAVAPAAAQHPVGPSATPPSPQENTCGMCHGAHGTGSPSSVLKVDESTGLNPARSSRGSGLGAVSQSCLRCHTTPAGRARQRQFSQYNPLDLERGKYLGLDLSDDHPLGRAPTSRGLDLDAATFGGRPLAETGGEFRRGSRAAIPSLECTTCHDPHSRTSSIPEAEEQRVLCGGCHEPGRYALRGHTSPTCTECHELHGGSEVALLAEPMADMLCNSCHGPGAPLAIDGRSSASRTAPAGHLEPTAERCVSCHTVHRSDRLRPWFAPAP